jgi:predicted outer membrane repeat protein
LTLSNGDLNQVLAHGGAVYSFGNLTVENCKFVNNRTNNDGGALAAMGGSLTVSGSTFTGNSAQQGGAIYVSLNVTATISSSSLVLNTATDQGGGLFILGATVTLTGTDVNGNSAVNAGGGIHVSSQGSVGSTLTLVGGTTVQNNLVTSASGQGGGIYFGNGTINLNSVWIGSNTATQGDGMYRVNGTTKNIGNPGVTWFDDQEFVGP